MKKITGFSGAVLAGLATLASPAQAERYEAGSSVSQCFTEVARSDGRLGPNVEAHLVRTNADARMREGASVIFTMPPEDISSSASIPVNRGYSGLDDKAYVEATTNSTDRLGRTLSGRVMALSIGGVSPEQSTQMGQAAVDIAKSGYSMCVPK